MTTTRRSPPSPSTYADTGILVDPHTAVGLGAARAARHDPAVPMVVLATAHPAKFPDAVERATGVRPPLPAHLADLLDRPERTATLPNDLAAVEAFVARAAASRQDLSDLRPGTPWPVGLAECWLLDAGKVGVARALRAGGAAGLGKRGARRSPAGGC